MRFTQKIRQPDTIHWTMVHMGHGPLAVPMHKPIAIHKNLLLFMWKNKVAPDMEFVYTPVEILGNAHMHAFSVHGPANSS